MISLTRLAISGSLAALYASDIIALIRSNVNSSWLFWMSSLYFSSLPGRRVIATFWKRVSPLDKGFLEI